MLQPFATAAQEASAIIYIVPMRRRTSLLAGWVRCVVLCAMRVRQARPNWPSLLSFVLPITWLVDSGIISPVRGR